MEQLTVMPPKMMLTALSICSVVRSPTSTTWLGYRIRK